MPNDAVAYKVLTGAEWAALETGSFAGSAVDLRDGYIHLSTASQLAATVARHFAGQTDLTIAAIDLVALGQAVRWEPARGGELFPHVYAVLTPRDVLASCPLERCSDGLIPLPR